MIQHQIVLVPGFFGFGSLGDLNYFIGVREALLAAFGRMGLEVEISEVPTLPTASIRQRAARVREWLAQTSARSPGPIHVVGHSTGGLDARLAIAPTASLPTKTRFEAFDRLKTLVTVATPHFGTPLASFFGSTAGRPLLRYAAAALILALRRGHLPLGLGFRLARVAVRADDLLGIDNSVADRFLDDVIADFTPARRAELIAFVEGISSDQSLIFQLTPAGCDLINAGTADPIHVRYASVVCRARPPRLGNVWELRRDPYAQWMHALYAVLHRIAGSSSKVAFPEPVASQREALDRAFGEVPVARDSDGVVPTVSQIWGEVIHGARGDHLDVIGHFGSSAAHHRRSADWIPSQSGFDRVTFEALWSDVAQFVAREVGADAGDGRGRSVGAERTQRDLRPAEAVPVGGEQGAADRAREILQEVLAKGSGARR